MKLLFRLKLHGYLSADMQTFPRYTVCVTLAPGEGGHPYDMHAMRNSISVTDAVTTQNTGTEKITGSRCV